MSIYVQLIVNQNQFIHSNTNFDTVEPNTQLPIYHHYDGFHWRNCIKEEKETAKHLISLSQNFVVSILGIIVEWANIYTMCLISGSIW